MNDISGTPAVVHFAGKVWMACKGEGGDTRVYISSFSASGRSESTPISGVRTRSYPALTVSVAELYLVWRAEHDNAIYWSRSFDGKGWSPRARARAPGVAVIDAPDGADIEEVVDYPWDIESDEASDSSSEKIDGKRSAPATVPGNDSGAGGARTMESGNTGKLHLVWNNAPCKTSWSRKARDRFQLPPALVLTEREARRTRVSQSAWLNRTNSE